MTFARGTSVAPNVERHCQGIKQAPSPACRSRIEHSQMRHEIERAYADYAQGRISTAEAPCRQSLAWTHADPDALHLFGVIALRTSRLDEAVDLLRRAIGCRPVFPDAYSNLGVALEAR